MRPTFYLERIYSDLTIILPGVTGTLLSKRLFKNDYNDHQNL